jgi:hypothetical protein
MADSDEEPTLCFAATKISARGREMEHLRVVRDGKDEEHGPSVDTSPYLYKPISLPSQSRVLKIEASMHG